MTTTPRTCVYVPPDGYVEGSGYVPSMVTEGEPGHAPLTGSGEFSEPWYWGHDYEKAKGIAADLNRQMGLTEADVNEIVASSMFPRRNGGTAVD
jgi:hypothetical protein